MPSCIIPFQYYYPDDLVSARHFTDLAENLHLLGWDVRVFTGNRYCRSQGSISPYKEIRNGVEITRFWYPPFSHSKNIGRLLNTVCLSFLWFLGLLFAKTDVVIFGTNPQFIYYMIPFLRFFRPKLRLVIWGFDLYPEAIIADGIKLSKILNIILQYWAGVSYRCCDLLIDIGQCMRNRFLVYNQNTQYETIVPWALNEPDILEIPDQQIRYELFGNAKLGILYSGTIGKAHQFEEFIFLARELRKRNASISFCFAGRGNSYQYLQNMITQEDTNISFAGFIKEEMLSVRLAAADIHMISLRQGWEGIVVPSKFFGSLASGRPLLYCGTPDSSIVKLIRDEGLGLVVDMNSIKKIADDLEELSNNRIVLRQMQERVFLIYNTKFSKKTQCILFDQSLRNLIK